MSNRFMPPRASVSPFLVIGTAWLLSGCVAAIVPVAAGGLAGRRVLHHRKAVEAPPAARDGAAGIAPASNPVATPVAATPRVPMVAERRPPDTAGPYAVTVPRQAASPSLETPAPPGVAKASPALPPATTWEAIARRMAGLAAKTPDASKIDLLPGRGAAHPTCGARPVAIAIDAATLNGGAYLYVGALYTMGYEIVLTARTLPLPPARVAALAKQGVPARVAGRTLFAAPAGEEALARTMIGKQWCVAALVGNRAADFPGGALPGTPGAHDGWFLVAAPRR